MTFKAFYHQFNFYVSLVDFKDDWHWQISGHRMINFYWKLCTELLYLVLLFHDFSCSRLLLSKSKISETFINCLIFMLYVYIWSFKIAVQPVWVCKTVVVYLSFIWHFMVVSVFFRLMWPFLVVKTWQPCCRIHFATSQCHTAQGKERTPADRSWHPTWVYEPSTTKLSGYMKFFYFCENVSTS